MFGALLFPEKFDFFNAVTVRSEEQIMNMYQVAIRKAFSRSIEGKLHGTDSRGNAVTRGFLFWSALGVFCVREIIKFS